MEVRNRRGESSDERTGQGRTGQERVLEMCVVCHLLAHCALVGVSGGLVVVGVGHQARYHPQDGHGVDLHVCVR